MVTKLIKSHLKQVVVVAFSALLKALSKSLSTQRVKRMPLPEYYSVLELTKKFVPRGSIWLVRHLDKSYVRKSGLLDDHVDEGA